MKDMCVVFPDLWPATLLAAPVSAMSISLSPGGFLINPQIRQLPSGVAMVDGLVDVTLWCLLSASYDRPWGMEVSFRGQFNATNRMPLSVCRSLSGLLTYFEVSVFDLRQGFS